MFTLAQLLCALLLPAGVAALFTIAARRWRPDGEPRAQTPTCGCRGAGLGGLVLILAVIIGHVATALATEARLMPPLLGWHWLPWAGLAVIPLLIFALPERGEPKASWRWLAVAVVAGAGAWLLLRPLSFSTSFTLFHVLAWLVAVPLIVVGTGWMQASEATPELPFVELPFVEQAAAAIATGAIAIGALATGSKDLGLLAVIIPGAIIGGAFAAWVFSRCLIDQVPWRGGTLVATMCGSWHLLLAANYSEMPWWNAPLFALALPSGLLAQRLAVRRGCAPRSVMAWRLGITVLVAGAAVAMAATLGQPASSSASASDGPDYRY